MDPAVSPQLCIFGETLAADVAAERSVSSVGLHVSFQRTGVAEVFVTDGTSEWLLSRVDPHVRHHVTLLVEAFPTEITAEGLLPCVQPQVCLLSSDGWKLLAADMAGPAVVSVSLKVQPKIISGLQMFTTYATQAAIVL